ncbi:MAG: 2-dehydro-3-deoxygalactonokinase [Saprospiraceae bacterium]|nr:2-dehydro-3-deoxygalactonokinase [Lewinella sp.]
MTANSCFISCDWGTSSFRLYLVNTGDGSICNAITEGLGIKPLHQQWQQQEAMPRIDFFQQYLQDQVRALSLLNGNSLGEMPVYISGMASSSIGMYELPYADLPFALNGRDLLIRKMSLPDFPHPVCLLSGLKSRHDVMRGEESQMIGLAHHFGSERGVAILPGTHSKHIHFQNGAITDFQTYMTGEFFAILSEHSILQHSLSDPAVEDDPTWFERGVTAAGRYHLLNASFHVRTNELLHEVSSGQNRSYLSGLLIGSELTALPEGYPVYLCGGGRLQMPYRKALEIRGHRQMIVLSPEEVEKAVVKAHWGIYVEDYLKEDR